MDHRHSTADLIRLGADVERAVLSRAVRWHLDQSQVLEPTGVPGPPGRAMGDRTISIVIRTDEQVVE